MMSTPASSDKTTACPRCYGKIDDRDKYCRHCGLAKLKKPVWTWSDEYNRFLFSSLFLGVLATVILSGLGHTIGRWGYINNVAGYRAAKASQSIAEENSKLEEQKRLAAADWENTTPVWKWFNVIVGSLAGSFFMAMVLAVPLATVTFSYYVAMRQKRTLPRP